MSHAACLLAAFVLSAMGVAAHAAASVTPSPFDDLSAAVPGAQGKTWRDLLSQIFPDITQSPSPPADVTATEMSDIRSIGDGDESRIDCDHKIDLASADARPIQLGDQHRWIVTLTTKDECVTPLAMFDGDGKLIDLVNAKGDQHLSFADDYLRPLGPAGALVIAWSFHDNSNESYDDIWLILAKPDGFSEIGAVSPFGSRDCHGRFTEEAVIRTAPAMPRIDVEVTRRATKFAKDCVTKRGREVVTTFDGSWRWSVKKHAYEPQTRELDLLAHWDVKQF